MQKVLLRVTLIGAWFFSSIFTLLFVVNMDNINYKGRGFDTLLKEGLRSTISPYRLYSSTPELLSDVVASISKGDARPLLLERFYKRYNSPLVGHGQKMVEEADKNNIDWRLLSAIAFQESNLCSKIPHESYNCWGWAIYTGQRSGAAFTGYDQAIEKISGGLRQNYYEKGLDTVREMMTKYTPSSNGSWAQGVQFALDLIDS